MLLEFCDLQSGADGVEYVMRGGIAIPTNNVASMWRKGKVIIKGPNVRFVDQTFGYYPDNRQLLETPLKIYPKHL